MKLYCWRRLADGRIEASRHSSWRPVRDRTQGAVSSLVDLLDRGAQPDAAAVERLLARPGAVVTGRAYYHLDAGERGRARRLRETLGDGCPLFALPGGLDPPTAVRDGIGEKIRGVVASFLASDPFYRFDPIPRQLARALRAGRFRDLRDVVVRADEDILDVPGIGRGTLERLHEWVPRRTEALGMRLRLATVRARLGPAGPTSDRVARLVAELPAAVRELDVRFLGGLERRVRSLLVAHGATTVGAVGNRSDAALLAWRSFGPASLQALLRALERLRDRCRGREGASVWPAPLRRSLLEGVREAAGRLPRRARQVLCARVLAAPRRTRSLSETGAKLGVSPTRVAQIEGRAMAKLNPGLALTDLVDQRLSRILAERGDPLPIDELERADAWFHAAGGDPDGFGRLLRALRSGHAVAKRGGEHVVTKSPRRLRGR